MLIRTQKDRGLIKGSGVVFDLQDGSEPGSGTAGPGGIWEGLGCSGVD